MSSPQVSPPFATLTSGGPGERALSPTGLRQRIEARRATVAVVGLGYVGLPLLVPAGGDGVVLAAHPDIDYEAAVSASSLVFDATGVTRPLRADSVIRL